MLLAALCMGTGLLILHREFMTPMTPVPAKQPLKGEVTASAAPVQTAVSGIAPIRRHIVVQGETLSGIAEQYHIDVATIMGANENAGEILQVGQELLILPDKGVIHTVRSGDTLWDIAHRYEADLTAICLANGKINQDDTITEGEQLFIPGGRRPLRQLQPASRSQGIRFAWPVQGEISSPFGYRWGQLHAGIDIANDAGTPVRAALAGRVIYSGWYGGYGKTVILEHGQGYTTLYGHLSQTAVDQKRYIETGELVGYMGSTGRSTGPHLHFEVRINDVPINPIQALP
ncbi:hypothetical protein P22_2577 [Propionispora sp. 2/2-37]|nr:hypothetical protein P22_2577 [Propionispora sp. 2/2-37]